ncbi:hypothetical protein GCM10027614_44240 [Micromonospora vulcania]
MLVGRAGQLDPGWQLAELIGAEHVAALPAAEPWLVDRFAEHGPDRPDGSGARIVALLGGRGGAGASVLAGGLAVTGARARLRTLLVDADPLGGGLDLVLGWEQLEGLRWPSLTSADGRVDAPALVRALPSRGDLVVLSWDRGDLLPLPAAAMAATIDAARRGRDFVVIDLPRQLDDAAVVALQAANQAFVVVPAELRATRRGPGGGRGRPALRRALGGRARARPRSLACSRGGAGARPSLAGTLRPEPGLGRGLERGEAPAAAGKGPLAALCQRIVTDLTGAPATGAA